MVKTRTIVAFSGIVFVLLLLVHSSVAQNTGSISYTLQRASNPTSDQQTAYDAITAAMDSAIGYYNRLTTITKQLTVQYNTGVQTADASFSGNIRFGSSRSYMVVHTAMHEIGHTVGIGTSTEYQSLIQGGIFTGTHATAMIHEIYGSSDSLVHGDSQHFWPFGLNYASEVKSEQDLINHCKMVDAMYKDMFGAEEFYRTCRIRSSADDRCMFATESGELQLGGCDEVSSLVDLVLLNEATYRLEFGDQVLDIPNESRNAGVVAGLWGWNGGAHQRAVFEFENGEDGPFRIRMQHSGLYLQVEGNQVVQNNGSSDDNFKWEMVDEKVTVNKSTTSIRTSENLISVTAGQLVVNPDDNSRLELLVTDVRGRRILRKSGCGKYELPLNKFAKGIYVVCVRSKKEIIRKRFIIR